MNRLKELRNNMGISQSELGKRIGASQMAVSKWEKGERNIDIERLHQLSDIFQVSIDYILGKDEQKDIGSLFRGKAGEPLPFDDYLKELVHNEVKLQSSPALSPDEQHLLTAFRSLPPEQRLTLLGIADTISAQYAKEKNA